MDTQMQEIFRPLSETLRRQELTIIDVFSLIGGFDNAVISRALSFNARDFIAEIYTTQQEEPIDMGVLVEQMYWRTFFHKPTVELYETAFMGTLDPGRAKEFVDYLVGCIQMDEQQAAKSSAHEAPTLAQ